MVAGRSHSGAAEFARREIGAGNHVTGPKANPLGLGIVGDCPGLHSHFGANEMSWRSYRLLKAGILASVVGALLVTAGCASKVGPSAQLRQQVVAQHLCLNRHGYPNHLNTSRTGITMDHAPIEVTRKLDAALSACGIPVPSG